MSAIKKNIITIAAKVEQNTQRLFSEDLTAEEIVSLHKENSEMSMAAQYLMALSANEEKLKAKSPIIQA